MPKPHELSGLFDQMAEDLSSIQRRCIPPPSDLAADIHETFRDLGAYELDRPAFNEDRSGAVATLMASTPQDFSWQDLPDRLRSLQEQAPAPLRTDFTWERWGRLLAAFEWACGFCGGQDELEQSHCVPVHRGGQDLMSNIVPACHQCNEQKGQRSMKQWLGQKGQQFSLEAGTRILRGRLRYGGR